MQFKEIDVITQLDEQPDKIVTCDPCQEIVHKTGLDFSYVINDITGRIEKQYKDGSVETVNVYGYDPDSCWD